MPKRGKRVEDYQSPRRSEIRLDGIVYQGYKIPTDYDSLLVKLTVSRYSWAHTIQRLRRALKDFLIIGPKTTIPFYLAICEEKDFCSGHSPPAISISTRNYLITRIRNVEIAKLSKLIAEIHARNINPYAY
jgi:pyruvate carboxylase